MAKHDRSEKCKLKVCEKRKGFTSRGDLFRHEREVHKLHGGAKKSLFCPFHDCKRSSGTSFTRQENLTEHVRRKHQETTTSAERDNEMRSEIERLRQENEEKCLRIQQLEKAVMASKQSTES